MLDKVAAEAASAELSKRVRGSSSKLLASGALNSVAGSHADFTIPEPAGVFVAAAPQIPRFLGIVGESLPSSAAASRWWCWQLRRLQSRRLLSRRSLRPATRLAASSRSSAAAGMRPSAGWEVAWTSVPAPVPEVPLRSRPAPGGGCRRRAAVRVVTRARADTADAVTALPGSQTAWHPVGP
jgi:hypothetical protein